MRPRTVHVLTFEGCPHADSAKAAALTAISDFGGPIELIEVDLLDPEIPAQLKGYPSPTVLVGMKDVSPGEGTQGGIGCRASGAPSAEEVRLALEGAWAQDPRWHPDEDPAPHPSRTVRLSFRPGRPEEAPEYVALRGQTRQNAFSEDRLRSVGVTAETWAAGIDSGSLPGHVCVVDGNVVGYCFGDRESGEIVVVAVLPEFEGLGVGREVLRRTADELVALGHRRLYLSCSPFPESRSYGFYRHLGWRSTGTIDGNGDEVLELVVRRSWTTPSGPTRSG
jgi:GNAT superfamily N-acetyltransferase